MSSWVAPALAAELWGTTVEDVLRRVMDGELRTREEGGFLFIDTNGPRLKPAHRPATFVAPTPENESDAPLNFIAARAHTRMLRIAPRKAA